MEKKTWIEKRDCRKKVEIKTIDKKFADIPKGSKMLITSPPIIDEYVKRIPFGKAREVTTMRNDLATEYQADKVCPVTTGIFLRIVSEAAFEELQFGRSIEDITPFWRAVNPKSKLASKLACGIEFIEKQRSREIMEEQTQQKDL